VHTDQLSGEEETSTTVCGGRDKRWSDDAERIRDVLGGPGWKEREWMTEEREREREREF
jgi:hypothetical protein